MKSQSKETSSQQTEETSGFETVTSSPEVSLTNSTQSTQSTISSQPIEITPEMRHDSYLNAYLAIVNNLDEYNFEIVACICDTYENWLSCKYGDVRLLKYEDKINWLEQNYPELLEILKLLAVANLTLTAIP